jgi:hypothetical protein
VSSQRKQDWWRNVPALTNVMDMVLPHLSALSLNNQASIQFNKELDYFCDFLVKHPLAIQHNKNKRAIFEHMKLNIDLFNQGKPQYH